MNNKRLLGAHVSTAGGVSQAPGRGKRSGCDVIQIFTRYPTRWQTPDIEPEEVTGFKESLAHTNVSAVASHASYLINMATSDAELFKRSILALTDELHRASLLGIKYVVVHPGSTRGENVSEETGIKRVAKAIKEIVPGFCETELCLETTAGQGSSIGHNLRQLHEIIDCSGFSTRVQVCIDSCHLHAAGYDISSPHGFEAFTEELENLGLTGKVKIVHMNDSKRELGSRVDRHEHIGDGTIGLKGFENLLNFGPFREVPFILETPKGGDPIKSDMNNLKKLRKLIGRRLS